MQFLVALLSGNGMLGVKDGSEDELVDLIRSRRSRQPVISNTELHEFTNSSFLHGALSI